MRQTLNRCALFAALGMMLMVGTVRADAVITTFDNFDSNDLYNSWFPFNVPAPTITSGPTSYTIEATGYGANYKYVGFPVITGAGHTDIQLTVNLDGPSAADGQLGPIVDLIDGDGTRYSFRWYGQTLGSHVLSMDIESTPFKPNAGSVAGLDLNTLTHMHMQLDPGAFGTSGEYSVEWQDLRLTNFVPEPTSLLLLGSCGLFLGIRRR